MIRDYFRTLTVSTLALSILAVPGIDANRPPKPRPDSGVRCAFYNRDFNEWSFVMPGDEIASRDANGNLVWLVCGTDGKWHISPGRTSTGGPHANPSGGGAAWKP